MTEIDKAIAYCEEFDTYTEDDDYCSRGKRKVKLHLCQECFENLHALAEKKGVENETNSNLIC